MNAQNLILIGQIASVIAIILLVLVQNRGASLSTSFGGSNEVYLTRRGIEKFVVYLTCGFAFFYLAITVLGMYIL
jgi:protein translocase SecG subunit